MSFIKHIVEFDTLHLVWQSDKDPNRSRYIVAKLTRRGDNVSLEYLNATKDYKTASQYGFQGYPAFDFKKEYHTQGVLDAFKRRLPPRTREDFGKYLEMFRLPSTSNISDFALLGYSGAKLPGDEFSIVPSFEKVVDPCEFLMEVAGFRYNSRINIENIELNSAVTFESEPENQVDHQAIKILYKGSKIGYVPRDLLEEFHQWLESDRIVSAVIGRKNGQPERPILYLFVDLKGERAINQQI